PPRWVEREAASAQALRRARTQRRWAATIASSRAFGVVGPQRGPAEILWWSSCLRSGERRLIVDHLRTRMTRRIRVGVTNRPERQQSHVRRCRGVAHPLGGRAEDAGA